MQSKTNSKSRRASMDDTGPAMPFGMDPSEMSPFERLAVWRMGPGSRAEIGREMRAKARWRVGESGKALSSAAAVLGHLAEGLALAAAGKLAPLAGGAGPGSLAGKVEARQAKSLDAGMEAISRLFSVDWNGWWKGWRAGSLAKSARAGASEDAGHEIYAAAAALVLSWTLLPSKRAKAELMPALVRWREALAKKEDFGKSSFEALLAAMEASGVDASWRPLSELPTLGSLFMAAHSGLRRRREIDPQSLPPPYFGSIKAQLEAHEIALALACKEGAKAPGRKPPRI